MSNSILSKCVEILKKDEIKNDLKTIIRPLMEILLDQIYPYLFVLLLFIITNFLLLLGIFLSLIKTREITFKYPSFF